MAELRTREGEPEIIVVHIEVQADVRGDLGKRMLEYYALLWVQFEAPVFPVLLILQGGQEGVGMAEYRHFLFGREVLRFQYARIALVRLSAREYVETSPLGAALSALMDRGKTSDELELRARMLKRVVTSGLDEERLYLLVNISGSRRTSARASGGWSGERSFRKCRIRSSPGVTSSSSRAW